MSGNSGSQVKSAFTKTESTMPATVSVLRKSHLSDLVPKVQAALDDALLTHDIGSGGFYDLQGMSGVRYRFFINRLVRSLGNPRYLEVGSWQGSTLCSAIAGNRLTAVAIDNWSEFGGPKAIFQKNVEKFTNPAAKVHFIESDFRKVPYSKFDLKFNIYLFDGPHEAQDQFDGLALALVTLEDEFVFIVDDWNWARVRAGTFAAIRKCNLGVSFAAEVRSTVDNTQPEVNGRDSDWHNGYFIAVLTKP